MGYEQVTDSEDGRTAFRKAEKLYKLYTERNPKNLKGGKGSRKAKQEVDLSNVIDLNRVQGDGAYAEERGAQRLESECDRTTYVLHSHPGLYLVLGAIPVSDQQYWIQQVLEVFPEPPNRTNHDADYGPVEGLWAAAQGELRTQADAHRVRSGKPKAEGVCRRASNNTLKLNKGAENGFGSGDLESHHSRSLELQSEFLTPGSSCLGEQIHTPSGEARTSFKNECSNKSPGNAVKEPVTTGRIEPSHRSTDSTEKRRPSAAKLLRKLRWATLGLQYDWSSRSYIESLPHAPFPADLADLAARLAAPAMRHLSLQSFPLSIRTQQLLGRTASDCLEGNCLNGIESGREIETTSEGGWKNENEINGGRTSVLESERRQKSENGGERTGESESKAGRERRSRSEGRQESEKGPQGREGVSHSAEWKGEGPGKDFRAEGAIVNYYGPADALSGHLDDVEENMDLPIVSISLGCKAVFLIGGETRDVPPTAIFLRSGDVVLMAGPARRCYHGVPRIFTDDLHSDLPLALQRGSADTDFQPFAEYIASSRININVRQVH